MAWEAALAHPAVEAVAAMAAALDDLAVANLWSMSSTDVATLVVELERVGRRVAAAQVAALGQAAASGVAEREGATSLPAWLKAKADVPVGASKARLSLHDALDARPVTTDAFQAGDISMEAATAVCAAIDGLPPEVPASVTGEVEELLVEAAREEGTRAVVHRAAEIAHRFAPDALARCEDAQAEATKLKLTLRHDGTVALGGVLDKETGALAFAVLGPLAAPLPKTAGVPDQRDAETRYGEAFRQVLRLASEAAPEAHGERPHIVVTIGLEALMGQLRSAPGLLDTAAPISAGAARRLACDAEIIPVVLGSNSEPLDIGRASRNVPIGMRRALVVRDRGCAFPGCERPASWCDAHHCLHWADGGPTALWNLVLVCARHHTIVHANGWLVKVKDGVPWFTPPPSIDPAQAPRLHSRFKSRGILG